MQAFFHPDDTLYLVFLAGGVLLPLALFWLVNRGKGVTLGRAALFGVCLIFGALLGGKIVYVAARVAYLYPMYGAAGFLRMNVGEFALTGAVCGACAALFACRYTALPKGKFADLFAPYGALMLALCRFAESFQSFGVGSFVTEEAHGFFPLALSNEYGEWFYAVYMLSCAAALILFLLLVRERRFSRGIRFQLVFTIFFAVTIITESLRSNCLRWGFVRVQQLVSVLAVYGVTAYYARKIYRVKGNIKRLLTPLITALLCVGLLIGVEFAIDRWIETPLYLLYLAMACAVAVMASLALGQVADWRKMKEESD